MFAFLAIVGFVAAWIVLYFAVIRPKLQAYRFTQGIYAQLDEWEHGFFSRLVLLLKGLKVAIIGFVTSSAPAVAIFYDKISGLDWTRFVKTETAQVLASIVVVLGILGPMLMVILHNNSLAEASATEPTKE